MANKGLGKPPCRFWYLCWNLTQLNRRLRGREAHFWSTTPRETHRCSVYVLTEIDRNTDPGFAGLQDGVSYLALGVTSSELEKIVKDFGGPVSPKSKPPEISESSSTSILGALASESVLNSPQR